MSVIHSIRYKVIYKRILKEDEFFLMTASVYDTYIKYNYDTNTGRELFYVLTDFVKDLNLGKRRN